MNYVVCTLTATAAFLVLAGSPPLSAQDSSVFVEAQTSDQYLARDHLIGAKVYGKDDKIVADVEDLIINASNQVVGVVLGTGGYFGFAEKRVGINLDALSFEEKDGNTTVSLPGSTPESLAAAPEFKRTKPAKTLLEQAREKALELTDKTKPALDDAAEKAKQTYEKAKEAAAPAIEKAKEAAQDAIDSAKETVAPSESPAPESTTPAPEETPAP